MNRNFQSKNPYYEPTECGLVKLEEIEYSDRCYQFDTRVVWRDVETGELYTARDSGCSCPCPFETYDSLASLEKLDFDSLEREVNTDGKENNNMERRIDFLQSVRHHLDKRYRNE
ncbi:MAG: hypothetical protein MN733_28830 [Nitrososphaera sp.]|nr:hypothetical protein [Nitrososphaera sp.]